jgi:hypothetical protein
MGLWMRITRCLHTESSVRTHESLYTLAAPGSVQKAAVVDPGRVVTGRPRLAGCNEDHWSLPVWSRERSAKLGCSVVAESLALKCPSFVLRRWMAHCTVLRALKAPLFIPVGAARRRPLEGGVAAMLHIHWLGGRKPG